MENKQLEQIGWIPIPCKGLVWHQGLIDDIPLAFHPLFNVERIPLTNAQISELKSFKITNGK